MAVVGTLNVALQATTADFENGMRRAQKQLKDTGSAVSSIQASFTGLGASLLKMGVAAAGITSIAVAIKDVVVAGAQLQTLTSALTAVTGSSTATADALALTQAQADKLGFELNALRDSYKSVLAATQDMTVAGASSAQIFTTVSNSGRTLQLSAEQTAAVMGTLTAALRRGEVTLQDLDTGFGGLPQGLKLAADAMGLTTTEVKRLAQEHALFADLVIPRVLAQMDRLWGSKAVQSAETLEATFGKLKNTIQQVGEALGKLGGNQVLTALVELWKLRLQGVQATVDMLGKESPLSPDLRDALKGLPAKGAGATEQANAGIDLARQNAAELTEQAVGLQQELAKAQFLADTIAESLGKPNILPTDTDKANLAAARERVQALKELYAEAVTTLKTRVQAIADIHKAAGQASTETAQQVANDAANALNTLKKLQDAATVAREDAAQSLTLFPENRAAILAKEVADLQKILEQMQSLRAHPLVDTEGDSAASVKAVQAIDTAYQALRDHIRETQLAQKDLLGADELIKMEQALQDTKLRLELNNPPDADFLRAVDQPKRVREEQALRERFALDPEGARMGTLGRISGLQAAIEELNARKTVRDMTQDQQKAVDELTRSLIAEGQALDAQLTALSKTHKGLGENRDAQIAATLAVSQATEEEKLNTLAIRERNKAKEQRLVDQENEDAIRRTIDGLKAERDAILLGDDARLASRLAKHQASSADIAEAQALAATNKSLHQATEVVRGLENAFLDLALTGQGSLKSLAQEFGRMALSIILDASGIKRALTAQVAQGIDWLSVALGVTKTAAGVSAGGSSGDIDFRAGGGDVYAGHAYIVGEQGAEVFMPAQNGAILPSGQGTGSMPPMVVNIYGVQDAAGLARSRGEIQRQMLMAFQQAQRAA